LSSNGKQLVVENSDHGMPEQAPAAVAAATYEVVMAVRKHRNK
jgi:hypothetical protein